MNEWVRAALIRAIKTVAQTAVSVIGTNAVGILDVDWLGVLSASLLAGILSFLTSVSMGLPEVEKPDELTDEEVFGYYDLLEEVE